MTKPSARFAAPLVLLCLYVVELLALGLGLMLELRGDRPLVLFLSRPVGWIAVASALGLAATLLGIVAVLRRTPPPRARAVAVPIAVNLISVAFVFAAAEVTVRLLARPGMQEPVVAGTVLLPHRWADVAARGRASLARVAAGQSYLVPDPELGWTIGPNRRSVDYNRDGVARYLAQHGLGSARAGAAEDAIYLSSAEGLRSAQAGVALAAAPARRRIAVVGDSFTFGLEVRYEDTWPHQLERALGGEFQVLNFGVDGYGIDQSYLRYRRDVLAWKPEIVILGVIDDDVRRTMCVYGFLCFPGFGIPFPKPRFELTGDRATTVNLPLPAPESLFATPTIDALPFVELDGSFNAGAWRWRPYHQSYAIRFLQSRFYLWPSGRSPVTQESTTALNAAIARDFIRLARERNTTPIVVVFPNRPRAQNGALASSAAKHVFDAAGVRHLDMIPCVSKVPPTDRFVALHYSPASNAAVATCLRDALIAGFKSG